MSPILTNAIAESSGEGNEGVRLSPDAVFRQEALRRGKPLAGGSGAGHGGGNRA